MLIGRCDAHCVTRPLTHRSSAQVENDDAAFTGVVFYGLGGWSRVMNVHRQLETRAIELLPSQRVFFPPPDLIDNERRKHRSSPRFLLAYAGEYN